MSTIRFNQMQPPAPKFDELAAAYGEPALHTWLVRVGDHTQKLADLGEEVTLDRLVELLDGPIDLDLVARLILGRYWRTASAPQREEYLELFRAFALHTERGVSGTGLCEHRQRQIQPHGPQPRPPEPAGEMAGTAAHLEKRAGSPQLGEELPQDLSFQAVGAPALLRVPALVPSRDLRILERIRRGGGPAHRPFKIRRISRACPASSAAISSSLTFSSANPRSSALCACSP